MKASILIALGLLAVIPAIPSSVPDQNSTPVGRVEREFKAGGKIAMDLSAGGYVIRGIADEAIRIRWRTEDPTDAPRVEATIVSAGPNATIRTRGPKKNFRVEIDLPQRADLNMSLTAGDLDVLGIEGNKSLSMWAGDVTIEVGAAERYKKVDASVRFGDLNLLPFGANKGGILRSFHWNGNGPYTISAKLFAGDLKFVR
jgi:hypothetical protein